MISFRPNRPAGLPSAKALQFATDAVCRLSILSERELHPVTEDQALQLAYLLTAYGLVPTDRPHTSSTQPRQRHE
jgi:hypothetical protein